MLLEDFVELGGVLVVLAGYVLCCVECVRHIILPAIPEQLLLLLLEWELWKFISMWLDDTVDHVDVLVVLVGYVLRCVHCVAQVLLPAVPEQLLLLEWQIWEVHS